MVKRQVADFPLDKEGETRPQQTENVNDQVVN
jgi:hypothetical protein